MENQQVVEVELANGATALVRATNLDPVGAKKTSALSRFDFDEIGKTLEGVAKSIKASLVEVAPDKVSVELGIELALKAGKLTGLIVEGQGTGSIAITLEWERAALDG